MKISEILDDIDTGALQLPVFQRGYVWKEKQVKKLMQSVVSRLSRRLFANLGNPL